MDVTGNGGKVLAKEGDQLMAENSKASAVSGKPSTKKTLNLTPDECLEILARAFEYCQKAGVDVRGPIHIDQDGVGCLVFVLANVRLTEDRRLVLVQDIAINGK
jgi:hypothetical protein